MKYETATVLVRRVFKELLKRNVDTGSLEVYTKKLISKELDEQTFRDIILNSDECKSMTVKVSERTKKNLNALYKRLLNRGPDKDAKTMYLGKLETKMMGIEDIATIIKESEEYKKKSETNNGWDSFCEKVRLMMLNDSTFSPLSFKPYMGDFCCLAVEGRENSYIDVCTYITMKFIPQDTKLFMFCTNDNLQSIRESFSRMNVNVEYVTISKMDNIDDYNELMMSSSLWEYIQDKGYAQVLVYQSDSFIFNQKVVDFVDDVRKGVYDIIGAPHVFCDDTYIVNGGLSIRNVEKMIECTNSCPNVDELAEDEYFNEFTVKPPIEISKSFAIEHIYNNESNYDKIVGVHQMWKHNTIQDTSRLFEYVLSRLKVDTSMSSLINECYCKVLKRPVDDEGLKVYSEIIKHANDIPKLEKILLDSQEYKNREYQKAVTTCTVLPEYKNQYNDKVLFHVVVSRLEDTVEYLEYFEFYPCKVFLYNRGEPIDYTFKTQKVNIIDIASIGHSDYAYITHIVTNYHNIRCPVLFMNDFARCPEIFKILDTFEKFSDFESLTQTTMYNVQFDKSEYSTIRCKNNIQTFNQDTLDCLMDVFNMKINNGKQFIDERYTKSKITTFVPHVQIWLHDSLIKRHSFNMYRKLKSDIEKIHTMCKWKSKCFSVLLERYFWSSVW